MPIKRAQVDRVDLLVGRAGVGEPGDARRNRGSDGRVEPQRPTASCRAFQMATIRSASTIALRSASARLALAAARAAARSRSCARRFGPIAGS